MAASYIQHVDYEDDPSLIRDLFDDEEWAYVTGGWRNQEGAVISR